MLKTGASLAVALFVLCANVRGADTKPPSRQPFEAGGVPITLAPPEADMVEAGEYRSVAETSVPQANRLLAAFVLPDDLQQLSKGQSKIARYGLVEVARSIEQTDITPDMFASLAAAARKDYGNTGSSVISSLAQESEDEFNQRMKSLGLDQVKVSIGRPVMLGTFFSKRNAYGFGMVEEVAMGSEKARMVMGASLLCVKKRLLFLYVCRKYENKGTATQIRRNTAKWTDMILKLNE